MLKGPEIHNPFIRQRTQPIVAIRSCQNMVSRLYRPATADQSAAVDIHGQLVDAYEGIRRLSLPAFDAVINEAVNEYGLTEEDIIKNGYYLYRDGPKNCQASMVVIYGTWISSYKLKMAHGQEFR